ncbi:MAG: glycosyltransferase family 9 protein [Bacteroidetes bacterium]|nr:glycosyltransferase family 9 protein [Bacteroidota bacterium]
MTSPVNHDVMVNNRYINSTIKYDKREFLGKGIAEWLNLFSFLRRLRTERFDLAIVPSTVSTSFTSDFFAYVSGARVRIGAASLNGVGNPSAFFFTNPVELDWRLKPDRHQTLRNLDVAKDLRLPEVSLSLEMSFDKNEEEQVNTLKTNQLTSMPFIIVYHPGAGKIPNRWDASRFAEVANILSSEFSAGAIITSGPMDDEPVSVMVRQLKEPYQIIRNTPIRTVAGILSTARLVITNDTGIMHVAAAAGASVLSLFGPTEPEQWAPLGATHRFIRGEGGDINAIQVEDVLRAAREMLSSADQKR